MYPDQFSKTTAMDLASDFATWASAYISELREDFQGEPDLELEVPFLQRILEYMRKFSEERNDSRSTAQSIVTAIREYSEVETLEVLEAVLLEAAMSSPLESARLAQLVASVFQQFQDPHQSEKARVGLGRNAAQRWNGEHGKAFPLEECRSHPNPGPDKPLDEHSLVEMVFIERWCRLNAFAAHLTQLQACPWSDLMLMTFNRAFTDGSASTSITARELNYLSPAAAVWIDILGKEAYDWSVAGTDASGDVDKSLFMADKWQLWKKGFLQHSEAAEVNDVTRRKAAEAWRSMCQIEDTSQHFQR